MTDPKLSAAMEDYLKAIFLLADDGVTVTTQALAERLGVAAPSVTSMVKRLHDLGLVVHSPYREIELTPTGRIAAIEVVRHHRLIELYLSEFLDVPWEQVHEEAERLEHVLSEDLESRMAAKLGQPSVDPHGHPIPTPEGAMDEAPTCALWDVPPETTVTVTRVSDRDPGLLTYLAGMGLVPGTEVRVQAVSPYSGTQTLRAGSQTHVIGSELARSIRVQPVPATASAGEARR
jgi:DtxR family transcriptional regulator, Mn-dependent transcriptional regulator